MYLLEAFLGDKFNRLNSLIDQEYYVYNNSFNFIGSANYPFKAVLQALSHPITLNPAEGFPGKRYFPNCDNLDNLENYGESLFRELFDLPQDMDISLQPHSGTQANQIIYNAILNKNDTVLIFNMSCGGHVSHNFFVNKYYNVIEYGIDNNERLNYSEIEELINQHSPKLVIAGASSYPREIDYVRISSYCKNNGSLFLADISHTALYHACGVHQSPVKHADFITFTTHKTTRGPRSGVIFFKKDYRAKIRRSIFPITQSAPKFNEILAKIAMCIELLEMDISGYSKRIIQFAKYFSDKMLEKGIETYTSGTDSHLVILKLNNLKMNGIEAERKLESINIFANRNFIPGDKLSAKVTSGLRFGFLTLATLDVSFSDFKSLTDIIYDQLVKEKGQEKRLLKVKEIAAKYSAINIASEEM